MDKVQKPSVNTYAYILVYMCVCVCEFDASCGHTSRRIVTLKGVGYKQP
jgi:hypothetical protein